MQRTSRLPRRPSHHPSVAELVKKYQDFLPPQGMHELARSALAPRTLISESEQEYSSPVQRRHTVRNKNRHHLLTKTSTSDFEQGYAANIAPRYLTHSRRTLAVQGSRIPGPIISAFESESSRRPSPEKRSSSGRSREVKFGRPTSPARTKSPSSPSMRPSKGRVTNRQKDKTPARPSNTGNKSSFRRPPSGPGSKVSNIAKQFERLGREAERSKSRYTVIRGRRARPVASARAKVEVLDSVKDAIRDESESSDSSSEADDEDEGIEERTVPELIQQSSPESDAALVEAAIPPPVPFPAISTGLTSASNPLDTPSLPPPGPISLPPSPFLSSVKMRHDASLTPPTSDPELGGGTERNSILKAISGLWLQPLPVSRHSTEADDPMSDPEHIFRDSSMIVRTDEPTSIIALALK